MPEVSQLFIAGQWRQAKSGATKPVHNPANGEIIGRVACADQSDLDEAVAAAQHGLQIWRYVPALERSKVLRKAAELLRARSSEIAGMLTREQGKPLQDAMAEINGSAEILEWNAEEGRRAYGRIIPARTEYAQNYAVMEPVGIVAAFTPWNFPISQIVRKIGPALAAGCAVVLKPPLETPAPPAELVRALADAGLHDGVLNLVNGDPAGISEHLIAHPAVAKISFTGSTAVGKQLAALAGTHMKRTTMELGGHAPAIVCDDADIDQAVTVLAAAKFRNAGQICIAPTRFLVQSGVRRAFVDRFTKAAADLKVGDGLDTGTTMGPLAHVRRVEALEALVRDAVESGASLKFGGRRIGNKGYFFEPTILEDTPITATIMNEEPFGPVALVSEFEQLDDAIAEANRLPYGLAAYAFTGSASRMNCLSTQIEAGMITINHYGLAFAELPFGGIKDSGYGSEGGSEALEAYLVTKLVTQMAAA